MIYVMSDIHGMYDKYIEMMDLIDLKETDTLYILGDIIDRGVNSMKILQDMMKRSNVFGIFGNHELMMADCFNIITQEITNEFLDSFDEEKLMKLSDWMNNGAFQTIQEFKKFLLIYNRVVDKMKVVYPFYESVIIKKPKKVNV
ncbi:metallophosphoesterase [Holdemanella biformis]|uniref:metallophosphoesterase n=2 Tax=Holdemanella biformis TaxID=1735 RepID=UPI0022E0BA93|nr:metallophosphoesterase [Holdemanella biformis]